MHPALRERNHRPWPVPNGPWMLEQRWRNLLFLHWEVSISSIRERIPKSLEIDTFDGSAWIAIVPFEMTGVGPRGMPKPKGISDFPEINVRTYVRHGGKPGVWFFSLDVPHRLPVWLARAFFHLPYFRATMQVSSTSSGQTRYQSTRPDRVFDGGYGPSSPFEARADSFERWATERYCFYAASRNGNLFRAEVQHPPWPLHIGEFEIERNTMLAPFEIGGQHPSVLFAQDLPVVAWLPRRCD
ncbi:DUF2071 domain-containing protein [Pelagicoccus sp. SDUM812003]|uniref:YqjF family protein n=1 Tax=Pelagicoccus sp. SDUM812003 TaxID=3041267 RepID=UPI00280D562B|nr:DUF2071 domain-containing protein [Pelagicoccus sp. SDUM812003]MDQ8201798.1 DUF2071 domain-containing protein [Pelagicoccus sp. SDUM812003]